MNIDTAMTIIAALSVVLALSHGRASYWKGKAEERDGSGWYSEALYWRRHNNADAAEWTEENS